MLKFVSFGSGSCGNCYYIYADGCGILIDAGVGIRRLKKFFGDYGFSLDGIKHVLVTHDHADHVKSVGMISNTFGVPVYATAKVHEGIRRNYCVHKKIDQANIRNISVGEEFMLDGVSVVAFPVPHDSLDNVGYKIRIGAVTFCLMTDIGRITDDVASAISEADYLVIEANYDKDMLWAGRYPERLKRRVSGGNGHLSNEMCAHAITAYATSRLRHVWLCHLSGDNNRPELARKTVEDVLKVSGVANFASLPVDVLKRGVPSEVFLLEGE